MNRFLRAGGVSLIGVVLLCLGALLMWGCESEAPELKQDDFYEQWQKMADESMGYSPVFNRKGDRYKRQKQPYTKKILEETAEKPLPTDRITMTLRNLPVVMVLRAVAKAVDQNIMINENIEGSISVNVNNTPWDQVFMSILKTNNLNYSWEGEILRVVRQVDAEKEMERNLLTVVVPIEFITDRPRLRSDVEQRGGGESERLADKGNLQQLRDNVEKLLWGYQPGNQKLSGRANASLDGRTEGDRLEYRIGSVLVDEHNNALIIQATREDLERLLPIIEALDRPTPQILIEAYIIEATKDAARSLGIQWGGLYKSKHGNWFYPGTNPDSPYGGGQNIFGQTIGGQGGGVDPTSGLAANFPAALGDSGMGLTLGFLTEALGEHILAVQLSALEDAGKINIVSSPSITTLDNHPAIIESGARVPFQTVDENGQISIEFEDATLKLEVKPHVIGEDMLKLNILTAKDELDFTRSVAGNPTIITKNAETNVILLDGQTTVIGGLTKSTGQFDNAGIPYLKRIPGLKYLFGMDTKSSKLEDILVFITPYILEERPVLERGQLELDRTMTDPAGSRGQASEDASTKDSEL